jgi:4-amino-4-deoxychorismate lyase
VRTLALAVLGRGLVDPEQPLLHHDDVALLRGQAAFETIRVYGGRPFGLDEHLDRLVASAERLELPKVGRQDLVRLAEDALAAAATPDCALRFYWTGGREGAGTATAMAVVATLPEGYDALRARGLRTVSLDLGVDIAARARSPWLLGGVKSTSYAVNIAARWESRRRGADDAILLASDGTVLEGPTSNVWWREGDVLVTPSLDLGILAGVTRGWLLRLAPSFGYRVREGADRLAALLRADEVLMSSSLREVVPVVAIDDAPIGGGWPGEAAARLQAALREAAGARPS